ncbi:hypothetical protein [Lentibacillus saliphilus]|uniref:hypothetical protein n=1 Tax=Lentibacillus saliphilus TaxID=2737028 RepID=UPI001C3045F1|nr:hypothetical protein [Lentibacillus saliphilus]
MLIELLNELLNDASPFYFYVSMFGTAAAAMKLIHMNAPVSIKHRLHIKRTIAIQNAASFPDQPFTENMEIQTWLTHIFKRIDAPDDDADGHTSSYFNDMNNIRGGQTWKKHLYSHSLKNTV